MYSLDTAITQYCLQNTIRSQTVLPINSVNRRNGSQCVFLREFIQLPKKVNRFNVWRIGLKRDTIKIKAVITTESSGLTQTNRDFNLGFNFQSNSTYVAENKLQSTLEDSIGLRERENIRRMRISNANKGKKPWNKGRKHSPETLQRIRERTRLAMQDPKVKMKLVNSGHAQSKETRIKIGVRVRMGWEKRREKLLLQETCLYGWQNLIAKAAKRGLMGEEEHKWDSYRSLDKQLKHEWVQSVEQRKKVSRRPKGSNRAPKSLEQRRKISEAISAKWSDPEYRDRVYSGLSKYHGITEGIGRKPKRNPTVLGESRRKHPPKRIVDFNYAAMEKTMPNSQTKCERSRSNIPEYKDPLVGPKLEMLKNIRAQRTAVERNKTEAVIRAKALISEAETAVKILEEAGKKSPIAQASLVEARNLIAEAIRSITSIDEGQVDIQSDQSFSVELSIADINAESSNINGFNKAVFENLLNEKGGDAQSSGFVTYSSSSVRPLLVDDAGNLSGFIGAKSLRFNGAHFNKEVGEERTQPNPSVITKKWVRGKLVELTEGC